MSYRYNNVPPKPENMLPKFDIRNGAIMRLAFGCYYLALHDRDRHNHIGWPSPNHPDHICQIGRTKFSIRHHCSRYTLVGDEVDLISEGYDTVAIKFDDPDIAAHLEVLEAYIDEDNPYLIRLKIHADLDFFEDKPKETRFTLFIENNVEQMIDAVCHGFITILPGMPYREED